MIEGNFIKGGKMEFIQKNVELKRKILDYCYNGFYQGRHNIPETELIQILNVTNAIPLLESLKNEKYLKRNQALLTMSKKSIGSPPPRPKYFYSISPEGINLIENQNEFDKKFPISVIQNNITNNVNMVQNNIQYNTTINFQQIYQKLEKEEFDRKDELLKHVKNIEDELKKDNRNNGSIWNSLMFIKSPEFHSSWLFPEIMEIVLKLLLLGQF